jgi:hypothetical protein
MKYESRADLIVAAGESIKMQEKAGITPVYRYIKEIVRTINSSTLLGQLDDYEFPLAVVEGKPVWSDSVLYSKNGTKYDMKKLYVSPVVVKKLSWNPPKPKKIMVELLREDAEYWANYDIEYAHRGCAPSRYKTASENLHRSVRKALGE